MAGRGLPLLALWSIVVLVAVSSRLSSGGVTPPEGAVQDVSLVIKYQDQYPNSPESAYCVTGDLHQSLTSTLLPNDNTATNVSADQGTYKTVTWNTLRGVRGVTCSAGGQQTVAGPIIQRQATLITDRPSTTINQGEDLLLPIRRLITSGQVFWQKEPVEKSAWKNATVTLDKELFIASDDLMGSGIYHILTQDPTATPVTQMPNTYGVFHLLVRECPADRYGSDCEGWCPDCLNGGVCDATSGECVCPAGVMGHRCQTRCKDGFIGRDCTVPVDTDPARQLVCVRAPLGCTCAPGYHGYYCNTKCQYQWTTGANCDQTCNCCGWYNNYGHCNGKRSCSRWGHCQGAQKPCGEGDLGLPRLRQPPHVTSITSHSVDVSFKSWRPDYDDGELPSGYSLYYQLQYWPGESTPSGDTTRKVLQNSTTVRLTELEPGTTYHLKVLVVVTTDSDACTANRGRTFTFNTDCPRHPPKPDHVSVTPSSSTLQVSWQEMRYLDVDRCGLQYELRITSTAPEKYRKTFNTMETDKLVGGLPANTEYTVSLRVCDHNKRQCSTSISTTETTRDSRPDQVKHLTVQATNSSLTLTWQPPSRKSWSVKWYEVLLEDADNGTTIKHNTSSKVTSATFEGLGVTREYLAKVTPCGNSCWSSIYVTVLSCWTRPASPRLHGTVSLVTATDTTITMLLPRLTNPPGWFWIAVVRQGRQSRTLGGKENLKKKAAGLVDEEKQVRVRRTASQEVTHDMYIATKVHQEGGERLEVTVGDNTTDQHHNYNQPLETDAAYWIVLVTEKWSGPYVERVISDPERFVATPTAPSSVDSYVLGLILGPLAALALTVALVVFLCFRKRRRGSPSEQLDVDAPEDEQWPNNSQDPMEPINHEQQNDPVDEGIYANVAMEVKKRDLEAYLLRAVMSMDTKTEFDNVPAFLSSAYSVSDRPENRGKNRYRNKVTYDDTRVILPLYDNIPHTDYINANYVEGPTRPAAFIAAQGPLNDTVGAFWRMLWHTDSRVILMVAKLQEQEKVKVALYWPEKQPMTAEGITVTPTGVTVKMDFVKRTFRMSVGDTHKEVTQYQYTGWPDHGVPKMPYGLAQMIKLIRSECASREQLTVHCSAGIGRTGTVILVMYLLDQLEAHGTVYPGEAMKVLRRGRGRLVENTEQYVFAHQVLHEVLYGLETSFPCHSFCGQLSTLRSPQPPKGITPLQLQYQKLKNIPKDLSFKHGKDPACAHLNRNQNILPPDSSMVFVRGKGYGRDAQYLNVIRLNGIDQKDAYLAGEHPQSHTLAKMWRLIYDRKVAVWVLVHTFPALDKEFPDVLCDSSALQDNMTLNASPTQPFQHFDERRVDVNVTELGQVNTHRCLLINLRGWPAADCLPSSPEPLMAAIEKAEASSSLQQQILFTCRDGVTGCGVMAALLLAVSRAKLVQEVDLYRSVAAVQQIRPQFIVSLEQYDFLHTAMAAFLASNRHYGNFG